MERKTFTIGGFEQALHHLKSGIKARVIGSPHYYEIRTFLTPGYKGKAAIFQMNDDGTEIGKVASFPAGEVLSNYWEVFRVAQ